MSFFPQPVCQIRVLSVRQPWASLIVLGQKTIEVRCWSTDYRGPVLILSGGRKPTKRELANCEVDEPGPLGCALGLVDLVDVRKPRRGDAEHAWSDMFDTDYAWVWENPRPLARPFPVKGQLGLYRATNGIQTMLQAIGLAKVG